MAAWAVVQVIVPMLHIEGMIKLRTEALLTDCTTATVHRTHVRAYGCALTKHQWCQVMYLLSFILKII